MNHVEQYKFILGQRALKMKERKDATNREQREAAGCDALNFADVAKTLSEFPEVKRHRESLNQ